MANKKQGEIQIELYSDLCPGNGYSYYGTIDAEAEHDRLGLPFIPARRIKGCLRECAELLEDSGLWEIEEGKNVPEELFGKRADDGAKGIRIENAYISEYYQIKEELEILQKDKTLQKYLSPDQVLDLFSDVKVQTRMENGVAENNSLRFTRIIHQFSPFCQNERLKFIAKVQYPPKQEGKLKQLCQALRHMGMHRNRGLGCVKCELVEEKKIETLKRPLNFLHKIEPGEVSASKLRLDIFLENQEPLIISGDDKNTTLNYIPGKSVLGALAGTLLSMGDVADKKEFRRLFLSGETLYSDFTISDGIHLFDPAPSFLNKLKKTGKYVNVLQYSEQESHNDKDYNPVNGNQPKKLKGKYIYLEKKSQAQNDKSLVILERTPEQRIIFHHRRGEDALLYSQTALKEGQIFGGSIICDSQDYKLLLELLENTTFCFGKSKTAQYGKCRILSVDVQEILPNKEAFSVKKDELIYVSLASRGIFQDKDGYTQEPEKVYRSIGEQLGLLKKQENVSETEVKYQIQDGKIVYPFCSIQPAIIRGYASVWNLHKAPIAGIEVGSTFVYKAQEDTDIYSSWVGERNLEGFGKVHLYRGRELPYRLPVTETAESDSCHKEITVTEVKEILKQSLYKALYQNILAKMIKEMDSEDSKLRISSSTIGRVTLMVKETLPKNAKEAEENYKDFAKRAVSIKGDTERMEIQGLMYRLFGTKFQKDDESVSLNLDKILYEKESDSKESSENAVLYSELCNLIEEKEVQAKIFSWWGKLMLEILVNQKYLKKFQDA